MCAIAGLMSFDQSLIDEATIKKILNMMVHRGKDNVSTASFTQPTSVCLGHRRLAIIDLDHCASQPMFYADNQLCITYNGEIYNYLSLKSFLISKHYQFKTESDTEVILAAYHYFGIDCVKQLNGMFAFAIWDSKQGILFCARDPVGIKPFYFYQNSRFFAFSSEPLPLADFNQRRINLAALHSYLLSMYNLTTESFFQGVHKLAPGHCLVLKSSGEQLMQRYFNLSQFETITDNHSALNDLEQHIHQAIKQQLVSDVPVGGFLSGGVDSGLITAIASQYTAKFHTYSIGYEGLQNNELPFARQIATCYQTKHTEVFLEASAAMKNLNLAIHALSEPVADPALAATFLLAKMAATDGVKVLLNGTGGDEIFAGYARYTGQLSFKRKMLTHLPNFLKYYLNYLPFNHKIKARLLSPALDMLLSTGGSYPLASQFMNCKKNLKSLGSQHQKFFLHDFIEKWLTTLSYQSDQKLPLLYQQMLFDLQHYLPEQLLLMLDQMSMAHTVEGRVPLLDIDLIQQAFKFKADAHTKHHPKALLKKIAIPYLGVEYVHRKKQGFAGSSWWWVKQHTDEFVEVLADLRNLPCLESLNIQNLINHPSQYFNDVFILYCFGKWNEKINSPLRN